MKYALRFDKKAGLDKNVRASNYYNRRNRNGVWQYKIFSSYHATWASGLQL
jgi:hypothetical protein